ISLQKTERLEPHRGYRRGKSQGIASSVSSHRLRHDFQRRDLVPFELEEESKVNGAAGKIANQVAGDDGLPVLLFARERLTGVLILCRGVRLPRFDCGSAFVSVPLVLHDGIFSETLRNGFAVTAVCGEVSGDGFWQAE